MKLKRLYLRNFRSYKDWVSVDFENITTFIGKNDAGKSTILEALEIFLIIKLLSVRKKICQLSMMKEMK